MIEKKKRRAVRKIIKKYCRAKGNGERMRCVEEFFRTASREESWEIQKEVQNDVSEWEIVINRMKREATLFIAAMGVFSVLSGVPILLAVAVLEILCAVIFVLFRRQSVYMEKERFERFLEWFGKKSLMGISVSQGGQ